MVDNPNKSLISGKPFFYSHMNGIQDPSSQNFSQLLGQPQVNYVVPSFQRDYSWEKEHWSDLWQDIQSIVDGRETEHYMGYLVLQPKPKNGLIEVIDGQQRIATTTILLLAIIKRFENLIKNGIDVELNQFRASELKNTFIGVRKLDTGRVENKLTLNRNNNDFFKTYVLDTPKPANKKLKTSNRLLLDCLEWFYAQLENYSDGAQLVNISSIVTTKLFFSVLRVEGEVNAFKVFETLNARGVELSSTDLLKNYLFQIADKEGSVSDLKEMEDLWDGVIANIGTKTIVDYIRTYWNSRYPLTRTGELFRSIRSKITTKRDAFDLVYNLYLLADAYNAILEPTSDFWDGNDNITQPLTELKLFRKKQHVSAVLVAYEKLYETNKNSFVQLIKCCSATAFRRNVISQLNPNTEEDFYNKLATEIFSTGRFSVNSFKQIYVDDASFKEAFIRKEYESETSKICRYILCTLEAPGYDYASSKITLEHIVPQGEKSEWVSDNTSAFPDDLVYNIGNLILLEKKLQKRAGNYSATIKLDTYKNSSILATKEIGEKDKWGHGDIEERQAKLAKLAVQTWQIQFLPEK